MPTAGTAHPESSAAALAGSLRKHSLPMAADRTGDISQFETDNSQFETDISQFETDISQFETDNSQHKERSLNGLAPIQT